MAQPQVRLKLIKLWLLVPIGEPVVKNAVVKIGQDWQRVVVTDGLRSIERVTIQQLAGCKVGSVKASLHRFHPSVQLRGILWRNR